VDKDPFQYIHNKPKPINTTKVPTKNIENYAQNGQTVTTNSIQFNKLKVLVVKVVLEAAV